MSVVNLGPNINLPIELVNAYNRSNNKMLSLICEINNEISHLELRETYQDLELLSKIVKDNSIYGYDFMIFNSDGLVYTSNSIDKNINTDDKGYIFVDNKLVIHSHEDGYIYGKNINELNKNYLIKVREGLYKCSDAFGPYGFTGSIKVKKRTA